MISKELWIHNILNCIKEIASPEFQLKAWVQGKVDYSSFEETMCNLFDDSFEEFIDNYAKQFDLTDEQIHKLDQIRNALKAYRIKPPEIMIKDPEWLKIQKMAMETLKAFGIEKFLEPSKYIFKISLLGSIRTLADLETQKRAWIEMRRPNKNPFQEDINRFFDYSDDKGILLHYKDYEITDEQHEILLLLHNELSKYHEKHKNEQNLENILNDPEWHKVVDLAKDTIAKFPEDI